VEAVGAEGHDGRWDTGGEKACYWWKGTWNRVRASDTGGEGAALHTWKISEGREL